MGVFLGKRATLPVRLIILRVSEQVAEQRRKRIRERAQDHSTKPSEELLYLAGWTIVVKQCAACSAQPTRSPGAAAVAVANRATLPFMEKSMARLTNGARRNPGVFCANSMGSWLLYVSSG